MAARPLERPGLSGRPGKKGAEQWSPSGTTAPPAVPMPSSSVPGSRASICSTGSAAWGCRSSCSRPVTGSAVPGAGTGTRGQSRTREPVLLVLLLRRAAAGVELDGELRRAGRAEGLRRPRRRPFDLWPHIRLGTRVVSAVGSLSTSNTPRIPGIENFRGTVLHTARWPEGGVELAGRRVGVIGQVRLEWCSVPDLVVDGVRDLRGADPRVV